MTNADKPNVLYRIYDADNRLLYVGLTNNPKMRMRSHGTAKSWWATVSHITVQSFATRDELEKAERIAIRTEAPLHNITHNEVTGRHYTLMEVGRMLVGDDMKHPDRWLAKQILSGRIAARKVGRKWVMSDADIEFALDQFANVKVAK